MHFGTQWGNHANGLEDFIEEDLLKDTSIIDDETDFEDSAAGVLNELNQSFMESLVTSHRKTRKEPPSNFINHFSFSLEQQSTLHIQALIVFKDKYAGNFVKNWCQAMGFENPHMQWCTGTVQCSMYLLKGLEVKGVPKGNEEEYADHCREVCDNMSQGLLLTIGDDQAVPASASHFCDLYTSIMNQDMSYGVNLQHSILEWNIDASPNRFIDGTQALDDGIYHFPPLGAPQFGSGNHNNHQGGHNAPGGSVMGSRKPDAILQMCVQELEEEGQKPRPKFIECGTRLKMRIFQMGKDYTAKIDNLVHVLQQTRNLDLQEGLISNVERVGDRLVRSCYKPDSILGKIEKEWYQQLRTSPTTPFLLIDVFGKSGMGKTTLIESSLNIASTEYNGSFLSDSYYTGFNCQPEQQLQWMHELDAGKLTQHFKKVCECTDHVQLNVRVTGTSQPMQLMASSFLSDNMLPMGLTLQHWVDNKALEGQHETNKHPIQIARRAYKNVCVFKTCDCESTCSCDTRQYAVLPPLVLDEENGKLKAPIEWCQKLPAREMRRLNLDPTTGKMLAPTSVASGAHLTGQMGN